MKTNIVKIITLNACLAFQLSDTADLLAQTKADSVPALNAREQSIVTISAFTARGDLEQLQVALNNGLDAGLTINETKEVLVHLYAYCGFPRSIRGLQTLMTVVEDRQAKGIQDEVGRCCPR